MLLRPREVAWLLGIGRSKAYELIAAGELPGVIRIGRSVRVSMKALREWIDGQAVDGHHGELCDRDDGDTAAER